MADLWRDFWILETGTGQQVVQLHDRYMMMMMMIVAMANWRQFRYSNQQQKYVINGTLRNRIWRQSGFIWLRRGTSCYSFFISHKCGATPWQAEELQASHVRLCSLGANHIQETLLIYSNQNKNYLQVLYVSRIQGSASFSKEKQMVDILKHTLTIFRTQMLANSYRPPCKMPHLSVPPLWIATLVVVIHVVMSCICFCRSVPIRNLVCRNTMICRTTQ